MISKETIDQVYEKADLLEVVKKFVNDLKQKGANWEGSCPFHDEKTGSFKVNPTKNMYKCFGCGAGGNNSVKFIMDKAKMSYPEAIRYLATEFNVEIKETEDTPEQKEEMLKRSDYLKINLAVAEKYRKNLHALKANDNPVYNELTVKRQLNEETISLFEIGYAPDEWRYITPGLIEKGLYEPATELGLINTKNEKTFDVYRHRIIFPIHNDRGEIVGFGGRKMEDGNKDNPKYINSKDSLVYKKDQVLFGLYFAAAAIRKMGFAIVVEGYYDVTAFHQNSMENTVAPCGTAFTDNQAKLLKRYTEHVVLMGDGDKAGDKSTLKSIDILLKHNFKVEVCPLPKDHDPDSFAREFQFEEVAA